MLYQGLSGRNYDVDDHAMAKGGEGSIHIIQGRGHQVAKVFKPEKRNAQREEKLRNMVQERLTDEQLQQIAWPQDVIYDQNGFAGYVMPKLASTSSLTEIYSTGKYDLRFRLMAAINLCAAVDTVHEMGQVCGDLNPQNICVNLDTNDRQNGFKITLVDTDSYHFTANGKTYRCEVGLGDYIAPELQKKLTNGLDLKSVPLPSYTKETDLFALAVHIFYLLMNGCHPFACAKEVNIHDHTLEQMTSEGGKESVVAPQPIENIKKGVFPFHGNWPGITTPVYAPDFTSLPPEIQNLFICTFVDGDRDPSKRVSALKWQSVLQSSISSIFSCGKVSSHYYFNHMTECPLCKVDQKIEELFHSMSSDPGSQDIPVKPDDQKIPPYSSHQKVIVPSNYPEPKEKKIWKKIFFAMGFFAIVFWFAIVIDDCSKKDIATPENSIEQEESAVDGTDDLIQDHSSVSEDELKDDEKTIKETYDSYISLALKAMDDQYYGLAIAYCDDAIALKSNHNFSKRSAYYWKAKAYAAENKIKKAIAVLDEGLNKESLDYELSRECGGLKEELEAMQWEAKWKAKDMKKLNKIVSAMKHRKYKKAGKLVYNYWGQYYDGKKIYIRNRNVVPTIKNGKGVMVCKDKCMAYYGRFQKGKMSGKGVEAGIDAYGNSYKIHGTYKNNKLNGSALIYQWNQWLGEEIYDLATEGIYQNNKENGRMSFTYYYPGGGVYRTCYGNSANGERSVIRYEPDVGYVFAEATDGWYIRNEDKTSLSGHGHPEYLDEY